jgi:hypothetical protein
MHQHTPCTHSKKRLAFDHTGVLGGMVLTVLAHEPSRRADRAGEPRHVGQVHAAAVPVVAHGCAGVPAPPPRRTSTEMLERECSGSRTSNETMRGTDVGVLRSGVASTGTCTRCAEDRAGASDATRAPARPRGRA